MIRYRIVKKGENKYQVQSKRRGFLSFLSIWSDRLLTVDTAQKAHYNIATAKENDVHPKVVYIDPR